MAVAVSATLTPSGARHSVGDLSYTERTVTFDNSYLTGGEPLAASSVNMKQIKHVYGPALIVTQAATPIGSVHPLVQTDGSLLLLARQASGAEVANATDLSALVIRLSCLGYGS